MLTEFLVDLTLIFPTAFIVTESTKSDSAYLHKTWRHRPVPPLPPLYALLVSYVFVRITYYNNNMGPSFYFLVNNVRRCRRDKIIRSQGEKPVLVSAPFLLLLFLFFPVADWLDIPRSAHCLRVVTIILQTCVSSTRRTPLVHLPP